MSTPSQPDFQPSFFSVRVIGDAVVAELDRSQIGDDENIEELGRELFALVDQYDFRHVVLDLHRLQYATSSVLGKMISLHRHLHRLGGRLVLCALTPPLEEILGRSQLLGYFHIAEDVDSAVGDSG